MLRYYSFTEVSGSRGTARGGLYERGDGSRWYLKYPESERQGHNEVMASRFYDEMGFDAVEYQWVDNGMVASRWREGLPDSSSCEDLRRAPDAREAFMPSALIANWDVIGLVYDNALYDPLRMQHTVFLDFGGAFDTRAMGGYKSYEPDDIPALDGFLDPSINHSAHCVFSDMDRETFRSSKARVAALSGSTIDRMVGPSDIDGADERAEAVRSRAALLEAVSYGDLF